MFFAIRFSRRENPYTGRLALYIVASAVLLRFNGFIDQRKTVSYPQDEDRMMKSRRLLLAQQHMPVDTGTADPQILHGNVDH